MGQVGVRSQDDSRPTSLRLDRPMTASTRVPITLLLTVGDQAELVTPMRGPKDPLWVPVAEIARDVGLPAGELPGRKLTAVMEGDRLRDFRLAEVREQ
jgi:hypothetical protein